MTDRPSRSDRHLVRQHISISNLLVLTLLFLWRRTCPRRSITNRRNVLQNRARIRHRNYNRRSKYIRRTLALYRVVVPTASTPFRMALVAK